MIKGSDLENRAVIGDGLRPPMARGPEPEPKQDHDEEDTARRILAARALRPPASVSGAAHCRHCWGAGRDAAVQVIAGEEA